MWRTKGKPRRVRGESSIFRLLFYIKVDVHCGGEEFLTYLLHVSKTGVVVLILILQYKNDDLQIC